MLTAVSNEGALIQPPRAGNMLWFLSKAVYLAQKVAEVLPHLDWTGHLSSWGTQETSQFA